jgi:hypothetical protein
VQSTLPVPYPECCSQLCTGCKHSSTSCQLPSSSRHTLLSSRTGCSCTLLQTAAGVQPPSMCDVLNDTHTGNPDCTSTCCKFSGYSSALAVLHANYFPALSCRFIDDGGHPDDFVRNTFRLAVGDNQVSVAASCSNTSSCMVPISSLNAAGGLLGQQ